MKKQTTPEENLFEENPFKEARRLYNEKQEYKIDEISQQKIAKLINKDKSIISKLEKGTINPSIEQLKIYHELFGASMEFLLGESASMSPENVRVGTDLGITDAVADTMVMLKNDSNTEFDYTSVLNAFIGNGDATKDFLNTILTYLYMNQITNKKNSSIYDTLMTTTVINYINQYVKPQLNAVLNAKYHNEEMRSDIAYTDKDYDTIQKMVESCYNNSEIF